MSSRCGTTSTDRLRKLLSQLVDVLLPSSITFSIIVVLSFVTLFIQGYDVALLLRTVPGPLLFSLFRDALVVVLMLFILLRWILKPLLSRDAAVVMLVLSLLALSVGVGGEWHWWSVPNGRPPDYLHVWFWPLFYPLMPVLKGWYISIVHGVYRLPLDGIYVEVVPHPFPLTMVWGFALILLGFQVPGVWMPVLLHVPYWFALSYGLTTWYNKAVQKALQKAQTER